MALSDDHKVKSQDGFAHSEIERKRRAVFGPLGLLFMFEFINLHQLFEDGELFTFEGLRILFALSILVFLVVIFSKNLKNPAR